MISEPFYIPHKCKEVIIEFEGMDLYFWDVECLVKVTIHNEYIIENISYDEEDLEGFGIELNNQNLCQIEDLMCDYIVSRIEDYDEIPLYEKLIEDNFD